MLVAQMPGQPVCVEDGAKQMLAGMLQEVMPHSLTDLAS